MTAVVLRSRRSALARKTADEAWRFRLATMIIPTLVGCFLLSVFSRVFASVIKVALGLDGAQYRSFTFAGSAFAASMMAANTTGISMSVERQTGFSKRLRLMGCYRQAIAMRRLVDLIRIGIIALVMLAVGRLDGVTSAAWWLTVPLVFLCCGGWGSAFGSLAMLACVPKGSPEQSQMVVPLFFPFVLLSSAYLPIAWLPSVLRPIARLNPLTAATDVIRASQAGHVAWSQLAVFAVVSFALGAAGSLGLRNIDS